MLFAFFYEHVLFFSLQSLTKNVYFYTIIDNRTESLFLFLLITFLQINNVDFVVISLLH